MKAPSRYNLGPSRHYCFRKMILEPFDFEREALFCAHFRIPYGELDSIAFAGHFGIAAGLPSHIPERGRCSNSPMGLADIAFLESFAVCIESLVCIFSEMKRRMFSLENRLEIDCKAYLTLIVAVGIIHPVFLPISRGDPNLLARL